MSQELIHARVQDRLVKLRLSAVAQSLDAILSRAAHTEPSYLDFLDQVLAEESEAKQRKRVTMGIQIAHFPSVRTLDAFDFAAQPSIDKKLVHELATGRFIASAENVLFFGPPGVGKTHLAIALGRAAVETGHSVLFVTAAALLSGLARAQSEGKLDAHIAFLAKPKLLIIDELGYLPLEKTTAHLFFQHVLCLSERGTFINATNQAISQWGQVFGDDMMAAAILDRLLHHSHTLLIQGDSFRLRAKRRAGFIGSATERTTDQGGQI